MSEIEFATRLFTDPVHYEEAPLVDRKLEYEWKESWAKTEFIRDVISLANTARLRGKPAYLLLGIDNDGGRVGVDNTLAQMGIEPSNQNFKIAELVKSEFRKLINNHIQPPLLRWDFNIVQIEQQRCGYLVIEPATPDQLFSVSKDKHARKGEKDKSVYQGQSWIRTGESKESLESLRISTDDPEYRYSYAEVPYVLPSIWGRYFEKVQCAMQNLTQDAPQESAYQPLRNTRGIPLQQVVDDFLAQNEERLLILQGAAGCGKSLFLQRLVNSLAEKGEQEMKSAQRLEQFTPPAGFIPIFYRLRDLTPKARTESAHFTKILSDLLAPLCEHGRRSTHPEALFENPKLNWLVVLDGLDELGKYARRRECLNTLTEFMRAYPRLRVILTTRPSPGISLESVDNAKLVEIAPLDESQITNFMMAYRTDRSDEEIYAFIQECQQWQDAWKLLSVPAYLNAAALSVGIPKTITDVQEQPPEPPLEAETAVSNGTGTIATQSDETFSHNFMQDTFLEVEAPVTPEAPDRGEQRNEEFVLTLPRLLDQIYRAFWEREIKRNTFENANHLRCGTHEIAAKFMKACPEHVKSDRARKRLTEKGLRWVLEMGILSENEYEHIFFTIPSAQVYSAARQLQGDIEGDFWDDIRQYMRRWEDPYRAEIENYYNDLTGNSFSAILQTQGGSNA